jgi:hypothetical protein
MTTRQGADEEHKRGLKEDERKERRKLIHEQASSENDTSIVTALGKV